jgi:RimJ/RimL family protein N-acetyltransferase
VPTLAAILSAETDRLDLRPLRPGDAAALQALTDDPTITEAISFLEAPFTLADATRLIAMNDGPGDCFLGIRLRAGGTLIGVAGAHLQGDSEVEIGYWLGTAHHGRGYASEAAVALAERLGTALPGRGIVAECRPANRASWRVLEKAGFRPTGAAGARPGRVRLRREG